ncbi:MAG: ATP synthase F0 subunit A [Parcubacteria group bacterium]|nr:MAG: ATP synthase F0 subunit A [Parcubacteria group bacterium]
MSASATEQNRQNDNMALTEQNEAGLVEHTEAENSHEGGHTLFAEPIFHIADFPVTNSLLTSWIAVFFIIILSLVIRTRLKKIPSGFQSFMERVIEGAWDMMDMVTGSRRKSEQAFPIVFSIFIFILVNNWLGLLPGVGAITYDGYPLLRGGTADLNTTLALGLFSVVAANIFGIVVVGTWSHLNKFINLKALIEIPKKIIKEPTIVLINPIHFFVGLIEIVSEIAKIASLSFRLFGNIFAGEVLLASISAMMAFGVPLPFMFLEIIVGIIQALIFAVLTLVYFTIASTEHEAHA